MSQLTTSTLVGSIGLPRMMGQVIARSVESSSTYRWLSIADTVDELLSSAGGERLQIVLIDADHIDLDDAALDRLALHRARLVVMCARQTPATRHTFGTHARVWVTPDDDASELVAALTAARSMLSHLSAGSRRARNNAPSVRLSPRQRQVTERYAKGQPVPDIAEELQIRPETVRTALRGARTKLRHAGYRTHNVIATQQALNALHR